MKCYNSKEEARVDELEEKLIVIFRDMQKADNIKTELKNAHQLLDLYASAIEDYNTWLSNITQTDIPNFPF